VLAPGKAQRSRPGAQVGREGRCGVAVAQCSGMRPQRSLDVPALVLAGRFGKEGIDRRQGWLNSGTFGGNGACTRLGGGCLGIGFDCYEAEFHDRDD
jgi:hypothetical protein